jgi:hypothetical protein
MSRGYTADELGWLTRRSRQHAYVVHHAFKVVPASGVQIARPGWHVSLRILCRYTLSDMRKHEIFRPSPYPGAVVCERCRVNATKYIVEET